MISRFMSSTKAMSAFTTGLSIFAQATIQVVAVNMEKDKNSKEVAEPIKPTIPTIKNGSIKLF
ncbi:MAG: hypothetical protein P4M12_10440 [Gammaproteobacteria bacterium]|nr:hypothetical protein [Gammaproteobacteria bacterium]